MNVGEDDDLIACPHCRRKVRQFVAEKFDCRRIRRLSPLSHRFLRLSQNWTVALFCDSVDRA